MSKLRRMPDVAMCRNVFLWLGLCLVINSVNLYSLKSASFIR